MEKVVAPDAVVPSAVSAGPQAARLRDGGNTGQPLQPLQHGGGSRVKDKRWSSREGDLAFSFNPPPPPGHLADLLHTAGEHLQLVHQQGGLDPLLTQHPKEKVRGEGVVNPCEGGCVQNAHDTLCLCY